MSLSNIKILIYQGKLDQAQTEIEKIENQEYSTLLRSAICHDLAEFDNQIEESSKILNSNETLVRLEAHYWNSWGHYRKGNLKEAKKMANIAYTELTSLSIDEFIEQRLLILKVLGAIEKEEGNITKSTEYKQQQLQLAKKTNDEYLIAQSLNNLATISYYVGDYNEALKLFLECFELSERLQYQYGLLLSAVNAGEIYRRLGNPEKALEFLNISLKISEKYNQIYGLGYNHWIIGKTHIDLDQYDHAKECLDQALHYFTELGNELHQAFVYYDLGKLSLLNGEDANNQIDKLYDLLLHDQNLIIKQITATLEGLNFKTSHLLYRKGLAMEKLKSIAASDMVYFEITYDAIINYTDLLLQQAFISNHEGSFDEARTILDNILMVTRKQGAFQKLIDVQILRSKLLMINNQHEEANEILNELKDLAHEKGLVGQLKHIESQLDKQFRQIEELETSFQTVSSFVYKIRASGIIDYLQTITKLSGKKTN